MVPVLLILMEQSVLMHGARFPDLQQQLLQEPNTSTPTVSQLIVGQYVYQLTVTDNNGATNSDQVTVTVNPAVAKVDLPPVANAGPSDTITHAK